MSHLHQCLSCPPASSHLPLATSPSRHAPTPHPPRSPRPPCASPPAAHAADTIAAGAGIVDESVARFVTEEGPARVADLVDYGVQFARDAHGKFVLSQEAAHSIRRVVGVSGDRAGVGIMQALTAKVRATPSIRVLEGFEADDLIVADGRVQGVRLVRVRGADSGAYEFYPACAVVLATGGIGALYSVTTNPEFARGEAIAMAARAGAVIADAEFVQFHPTAINIGLDPAPLATEALRGEGATLVNGRGERFMLRIDARGELSPRDIVARGVFAEVVSGRGAFLDCRKAIGPEFPEAFPTAYESCRAAGIDPVTDLIPVAPAAHYHTGGIATDAWARTSVTGPGAGGAGGGAWELQAVATGRRTSTLCVLAWIAVIRTLFSVLFDALPSRRCDSASGSTF